MKSTILITLMLLTFKSFSQENVFTFNNGTLISENEVRSRLAITSKTLPFNYDLRPVIYHKAITKDTVVNYLSFFIIEKTSGVKPASFTFEYQQDSLYLLLNQPLPAFKLRDMDGKEISSTDLLGKPTLINFWATSCGPCIAEMPQLSRLKERFEGKMNFLSITENSKDRNNLVAFLENKDFNFQVLELGEAYKEQLKIKAIPKNLFIDREGILRYIQNNYPLREKSAPVNIDDKNNYFTKIINQLINE